MTPDEITAAMERISPQVPEEALRAAGAHRAELTPRLLALVRLPGEQCFDLSGDNVTKDMDRLLA